MKKALEQNAAKDPNMLGALSAAEVLKTFGSKLSIVEKQALIAQTKRLALTAELEKHLRKVGGCLMTKSASAKGGDFDWINGDPKEIFKSQYKFTLSHEIGHSLGMTHNFIASADKANYEFAGQQLGRRYSSVMDYLPDDVISYKGLGPYDAHFMRATHAQYVELGEEALANVKDGVLTAVTADGEEVQVSVKGGKLIHLSDVKKIALGDKSWWNLDQAKLSAVGLKKYLYCSDMEADGNGSPLCNRWDAGGSAAEIVNYYAEQYRSAYPLLNHKGNRINIVGFGGYVGRLFSYLLPIRFFNEELFYQLITRSFTSQEELNDYIEAALTAHSFLLEVVATPTAPKPFLDSSRFVPFTYAAQVPGDDGQPIEKEILTVVEEKSNSDLAAPGVPNIIDTRGTEVDKAIGLLMLTQQDMGHPRYSANSIRFSFAELESMLMGRKSIRNNLTMRLLHSLISDNAMVITNTAHGPRLLPPSFVSETSDLVRYYALLGSNAFIDSEGITSDTNLASRFHTGSTKAAWADRFQVAKLGEALNSPHVVKFHALEGAESSHDLIRRSAQKRAVLDNEAAITEAYVKALTAQTPEERISLVKVVVEKIKTLNSNGLIVNEQERAQQLSEEVLVGASLQFAAQTHALIEKNWRLFAMFEGMLVEILKPNKNTNGANVKGLLFLNVMGAKAIEAIFAEVPTDGVTDPEELKKIAEENAIREIKRNFLNAVIDTSVLESNHGIVVNNLQRQNQMLEMMYPEKNK
jgi:hypothetical protein